MILHKRIFKIITEEKLTLFLLITLWLCLEYIGLGPYSYIRIHDSGDSLIPRHIVFASDFFKHGVTYWFPYMGSGVDRLANDLLYPKFAVLLFSIFPGWFAYQLITVAQFFLAGYFTYRLCKDYLKLSDIVSVCAGSAVALNCNDALGFQLGYAGFPLILWSIEKIVDSNNKYRYLLIAMLGVVYSFCSSFPLTIPFTLSATLLWFAFRRKIDINFIFLFSTFALFTILLQYSIIHSLLLNSHASHRADWGLQATSQGPIGPHIYFQILQVGIKRLLSPTIILLTFIGLVISRFKSRSLLYLFSFFMFCTLGASVIKLITFYFKKHISFLGGFQFDRFYELAPFFGALCVASSLDLIRDRIKNWLIVNNITTKTKTYSVFTIFIVIFFSLLFYKSLILKKEHIYTWLTAGNYIANYKSEAFQRVIIDHNNEPFRIATIYSALHPAFANAYGIETVDGYINLYPKSYQKFWSKIIEPLTDRDIDRYYYFNHWGNRVYLFSHKDEEIIFDNYYRLNLLSLANTKYIVSRSPIKNNNLLPISEPVKSSSVPRSIINQVMKNTVENFEGRSLYIYENKTCLPRYFFAKDVIIFNNSNDMLNKMCVTEINSLKNTVHIEGKYLKNSLKSNNSYSNATIKLDKYSPDRLEFSVRLDGSGVLVVSNTYSPYWKCKVNGISTEIFPAYSTFWGIFLEKTARKVVFYYDPPYKIYP